MKKLLMALLVLMLLAGCSSKSETTADTSDTTSETEETDVETSASHTNPWLECETIAEVEGKVGFTVFDIESIEGQERTYIAELNNSEVNAVEVQYGDVATLRKCEIKGGEDISGDYNEYSYTETVEGDINYQIKGNEEGVVNNVVWTTTDYSYSITSSTGLSLDTVASLVEAMTSYEN